MLDRDVERPHRRRVLFVVIHRAGRVHGDDEGSPFGGPGGWLVWWGRGGIEHGGEGAGGDEEGEGEGVAAGEGKEF